MEKEILQHFGTKGMRWGFGKSRDRSGKEVVYHKESTIQIKIDADGSKTIPKGFMFNRVGKSSIDINKSGALYVSYGKEDTARYVKNLGPSAIGKLLNMYADTVQHISAMENLKVSSDIETAKESAVLLLKNKELLNTFNKSIYSTAVTNDFGKNISSEYVNQALKNPSGKDCQKISYGLSTMLGDGNYHKESKIVYDHFRKKGYDAIPDVHDVLSGTSKTATIIINPEKVKLSSSTVITKEIMKAGKTYIKSVEKLKPSDIISG